MALPTFFLPRADWPAANAGGPAGCCALTGAEAHHLGHVLRLPVGAQARLLDGTGGEGVFCVEKVTKKAVTLRLERAVQHPAPRSRPIMALAWSKATRRGFFMEKAVELGVHEVWLWQGERSQGRLPRDIKDGWQAQMIAGVKQCGNPWLPTLRVLAHGVAGLVAAAAGADHRLLPWESQQGVPLLTPEQAGQAGVSVYVIGPEGGFSPAELEALGAAGFTAFSLGTQVLRCETAALLCLGIHWWAAHAHGLVEAKPCL